VQVCVVAYNKVPCCATGSGNAVRLAICSITKNTHGSVGPDSKCTTAYLNAIHQKDGSIVTVYGSSKTVSACTTMSNFMNDKSRKISFNDFPHGQPFIKRHYPNHPILTGDRHNLLPAGGGDGVWRHHGQ